MKYLILRVRKKTHIILNASHLDRVRSRFVSLSLITFSCVGFVGEAWRAFSCCEYTRREITRIFNTKFRCLSKVCVPAEYIEDGYHFKHCAPVIIIDPLSNQSSQIRFNMDDRALFNQIPQEEMLTFYKHYKALAAEIQSEQNEWRFKLEPGTVCIFDTWRLLHGRTEYSGRRKMVGGYVARSEFLSVARRFGLIH